jgi:hypothetical protein
MLLGVDEFSKWDDRDGGENMGLSNHFFFEKNMGIFPWLKSQQTSVNMLFFNNKSQVQVMFKWG